MNINEMSQEFDILYNQVNSNLAANIDEYEKSVFLTKAQDEIVKAYFDPRGNKFFEGFDDGQKRQYDFSLLIKNVVLEEIESEVNQYDPRSYIYVMPEDLFLTLNESVIETYDNKDYIYLILPISYAQYGILMRKPYQYPPKRLVWRLITGLVDDSKNKQYGSYCEIIGRFKNNSAPDYKMRYVTKPTPIILVNLRDSYEGLSIDGKFGDEVGLAELDGQDEPIGIPCKLPEAVHREIVQRAVELATAVYNPQVLNNVVGIGNVSATNLGIVPRLESK